jgi:hypothetical protein
MTRRMRRTMREAGMGVSEENERKQAGRSGNEQEEREQAGGSGEERGGAATSRRSGNERGGAEICFYCRFQWRMHVFMTNGFEMS